MTDRPQPLADIDWSDAEVLTALADVEPFADPLDEPVDAQHASWRKWVPSLVQIEFTLLVLIGWMSFRFYLLEWLFG